MAVVRPPKETDLDQLKGVGPSVVARLSRLGINRVSDLLFHLPLRYEDRTRIRALGGLRAYQSALVEGRVELAEQLQRGRRSFVARICDGTGALNLRFFHYTRYQRQKLIRGARVRCFGEVRPGPAGLEMVHPEYEIHDGESPAPPAERLTPVYPVTEGISQGRMRAMVEQALAHARSQGVADLLPTAVRRDWGLIGLIEALETLHRPRPGEDLTQLLQGRHPARLRLVLEELTAHQLSLRRVRALGRRQRAPVLAGADGLRRRLRSQLGFELTAAQRRVSAEISRDLASGRPMMRLLQGDVGAGKTVVAALAAVQAVAGGYQVAFMAPTELLAEQHLRTLARWLEPAGVSVVWLSGRQGAAARRQALARIADGEAAVAVGTHALFQDDVRFQRLGLAIIDEQHRFGVHQRLALREKGATASQQPHQLIMTATPIPRTLAMSVYADLDLSVLDELPPGRIPVRTVVTPESRRDEVVERIAEACRAGAQAYWVCPLIEESEALECQAAQNTAQWLSERLGEVSVGLVHGRMKPAEREAVMARFQAGELGVLVATTVIEVGVDVANASLMVIENAERLGLSQLHQLRGRVGRGAAASSCVLLYHGPLSETARARLRVLRDNHDGFEIARRDLSLRGPGELLGTRQTGELSMRVADLVGDADLLESAQALADRLLRDDPVAVDALIRRWLAEADRYAQA